MPINWSKVDDALRAFLGLKYHLVGVKFRKKPVSDDEDRLRPERPMAYCNMVKLAALDGRTFIYPEKDELCPTAKIILGFCEPKFLEIEPRVKPSETKSIKIAPLNQFREEPDTILLVLTPKQLMDLNTILQIENRQPLVTRFKSEAACADFTAIPLMEKRPNISMLCRGSRFVYSDYRDYELIYGAPPEIIVQAFNALERLTKVRGALCGCRVSDIPESIVNAFEEAGLTKSTDFFFGRVEDLDIRVYLNKDSRGEVRSITLHLPIKTASKEKAKEMVLQMNEVATKSLIASQRENWVDLTMTATKNELSIDFEDAKSIKTAIKAFVDRAKLYLKMVGFNERKFS